MIKIINFLFKVVLLMVSILTVGWTDIIISLLLWDGRYLEKASEFVDLFFKKKE